MKFRYVYEQIVNLKVNETNQARWKLSTALSQYEQEQNVLQALLKQKDELQSHIHKQTLSGASVTELQSLYAYLEFLENSIRSQSDNVSHAANQVKDTKQTLQHRMIDEKKWNKSKEKAYRSFLSEFYKKEQEELDEMALQRLN